MPKFEHLGGGAHHHSDNKVYKQGDILDSDIDMEKKFPGKYKKVAEPTVVYVTGPAPAAPEKPEAPKVEAPPEKPAPKGKSEADARGDDVTSTFDVQKGIKVFKRGDLFHVYEGEKAKPINDKGLKKSEVESAVEKYLAE